MKITYTPEKVVAEMSHDEAIRIASTMCGTLPGPRELVILAVRMLNKDVVSPELRQDVRLAFPVELHLAEQQYVQDNNLTPEVMYEPKTT